LIASELNLVLSRLARLLRHTTPGNKTTHSVSFKSPPHIKAQLRVVPYGFIWARDFLAAVNGYKPRARDKAILYPVTASTD